MDKDNGSRTYSFWLPAELVTRLDGLAAKSKRSRNQVAELLLQDALRRDPEKVVGA